MDIQNNASRGDAWMRAGGRPGGRPRNLPNGFRLYCDAEWIHRFRQVGKSPVIDLPDGPQSLGSLAAQWISEEELDRLIDGKDIGGSGCYLTVTSRLARLWNIAAVFQDRKAGRFVPTVYPRLLRRPHLPPSPAPAPEWHGPSAVWRERAVAIWTALPEHDSDIFDRPAETESPKNKHLAKQLKPLLAWRRMEKPSQAVSTNWLVADNENYDEDHADARPAVDAERRYRAGPKEETLIKMAGPVEKTFRHARLGGNGEDDCLPLFPPKMGKLAFSNGSVEERGERLPRGAIRHYDDEFTELLGSEPDQDERVRAAGYWASLYNVDRDSVIALDRDGNERPRFTRTGRMRRKVKMTQADQLEVLATQPHPPIKYGKPGLPRGHEDIGAQFVGGWISRTKGKSGVERWEDVSDELARRSEFEHWAKALGPEMEKVMHLGLIAANFKEIGEAFGKDGKNAERHGKRILIAANNNSKEFLAA